MVGLSRGVWRSAGGKAMRVRVAFLIRMRKAMRVRMERRCLRTSTSKKHPLKSRVLSHSTVCQREGWRSLAGCSRRDTLTAAEKGVHLCVGGCARGSRPRGLFATSASGCNLRAMCHRTTGTEAMLLPVQFSVLRRVKLLDGPYVGPEDVSTPACVLCSQCHPCVALSTP